MSEQTPGGVEVDPHDAVEDLDDSKLQCRELGHRWSSKGFTEDQSSSLLIRRLRCTICRCQRTDRMTRWGVIQGRSYEYPDGYQIPGMRDAGIHRSDFRRLVLVRAGLVEAEA